MSHNTSEYDPTSVRALAHCLELPPDFEVVRDIFGYTEGPPGDISLLQQMRLCAYEPRIDINIIRVGIESFTQDDEKEIDAAVASLRATLARYDFCVGSILHSEISTANANGRENIGSLWQAEELTHEWSVQNWAIDVFVVRSFIPYEYWIDPDTLSWTTRESEDVFLYPGEYRGDAPSAVFAPLDGPDNKDRNGPMTGVVLGIEGSNARTGYILTWGVCRYLGAKTSDSANNMMWVGPVAHPANELSVDLDAGELTNEQLSDMSKHDFMRPACGTELVFGWSSGF